MLIQLRFLTAFGFLSPFRFLTQFSFLVKLQLISMVLPFSSAGLVIKGRNALSPTSRRRMPLTVLFLNSDISFGPKRGFNYELDGWLPDYDQCWPVYSPQISHG